MSFLAVDERHALDELDDQLVTVDLAPAFLRLPGELEHHRQRRRPTSAAFRLSMPMTHGRKGRFDDVRAANVLPVLGGEVVEGEKHVLVLHQKFHRLRELRAVPINEFIASPIGWGVFFSLSDSDSSHIIAICLCF